MLDLDMSPYAVFVWSAWAISALGLGTIVVRAVAAARRWKTELARLEAGTDPATPEGPAQAARSATAETSMP